MTSNFTKYKNNVLEFKKKVIAKNQRVINKAGEWFLEEVKKRTPVGNPSLWKNQHPPRDYVPGTLRKSWEINYTNSSRDFKTGRFTSTSDLLSTGGIKANSGMGWVVFNPQPYAHRVEFGWSSQAPEGMMRVTFKLLKGKIRELHKSEKL